MKKRIIALLIALGWAGLVAAEPMPLPAPALKMSLGPLFDVAVARATALGSGGGASGGGGWSMSAVKVFADTPVTVASTNTMYPCNAVGGATVFNLPACSGKGNLLILLKKTDSSVNKCEFAPNGADTIDGANAVFDILTQWSTVMVQCDGTSAWYIE